jgi:Ion channel
MADPVKAESAAASGASRGGLFLRERRVAWVRTSGLFLVFVLMLLGIFIIPAFVPTSSAWRNDHSTLTLILLSGIVAVAEHRKIVIMLIALSGVVILARWGGWLLPIDIPPVYRDASMLAALLVLSVAVGINVFALGHHALRDRIFGAIVLYMLLGLMWAVAYAMVDRLVPHAFAGQLVHGEGIADWVYFSFVTLTTLGYGDITPVARVVRSLAILEALIGQLYPAIIIARLVSLQGSDR